MRTRTARRTQEHEVTHGPAEPHGHAHDAHDDAHGGHGHGPWHGPHESPTPMTFPLMALAVGAIVAGFVGIPAALGGGNAIEHFLEPSFTASAHVGAGGSARRLQRRKPRAKPAAEPRGEPHASRGVELGLMGFSVLIARRRHPARAEVLRHEPGDFRAAWPSGSPARTALLSNKYYVDELYNATVDRRHVGARRAACGPSIARVVDGAVNGTGLAHGDQRRGSRA